MNYYYTTTSTTGDYIYLSYDGKILSKETPQKKNNAVFRCEHCGRKCKHNDPLCPSCGAPLPD